jgi:pimeloyl-ACP methyl ester carboxylesterase
VLGQWAYPSMTAIAGSITDDDIDEFARTYARPGGWNGAVGLYRSMLAEADQITDLARSSPLTVPTLAIGAAGGPFTATTVRQVTHGELTSVQLDGVGHYAVQEAPQRVAEAILGFTESVDATVPRPATDRR